MTSTEQTKALRKRYKLALDWPDFEITIDVDHAILDQYAADVNNFWSEADARLADADDNVVIAAIKMAGSVMLDIRMGDNNPYTIQREFDRREGFPPNTFFYVDSDGFPEFDSTELTLTEVE
jgi:hypothetical protein